MSRDKNGNTIYQNLWGAAKAVLTGSYGNQHLLKEDKDFN
jgi:hypothetical protein